MDENEVNDRLNKANKTGSVIEISQEMISMMKEDSLLNFAVFHKRFRKIGSLIYLVAVPRQYLHQDLDIRSINSENPPGYFLWVCLWGELEYNLELERYGLTQKQNLENLKNCGVLIPKEDNELA